MKNNIVIDTSVLKEKAQAFLDAHLVTADGVKTLAIGNFEIDESERLLLLKTLEKLSRDDIQGNIPSIATRDLEFAAILLDQIESWETTTIDRSQILEVKPQTIAAEHAGLTPS